MKLILEWNIKLTKIKNDICNIFLDGVQRNYLELSSQDSCPYEIKV